MKPIKIRVLRYNSFDANNFVPRYDIKVYKANVLYWTKSVYGDYKGNKTVQFMVDLFEACGIKPEVIY